MRIVTYNIRGGLGMDNVRSIVNIGETLRPLSADIICLQEVHQRLPWSGRQDQPALLEQLLARKFTFQRNLRMGFGGYGVGIAARGTIVEKHEHLLPSVKEQRGALELRLRDVGGFRSLTVFCTHWGLDGAERLQQAEALAEHIKVAPHPIVVCGDLNEDAESAAVLRLKELTGLIDIDSAHNRTTFVSDNPTVRIDFVLISPDIQVDHVEVPSTLASDHLPVVADLSLVASAIRLI